MNCQKTTVQPGLNRCVNDYLGAHPGPTLSISLSRWGWLTKITATQLPGPLDLVSLSVGDKGLVSRCATHPTNVITARVGKSKLLLQVYPRLQKK